jgi:hypothetical protein
MNPKNVSEVASVGIRPESSILTVLSALNYSAWYAIAEFVDNSIQSYQNHKNALQKAEGKNFKLKIEIRFDRENESIEIIDNAAGIYLSDYQRAFRPAALPENNTGLSEFGMGMKSAACWFTWTWSVRSKALGEAVERQVWFDVKKIASEKIDELPVIVNPSKAENHYTIIRLEKLGNKFPATKTYGKIRSHLASIYRQYLRSSDVDIYFDRDPEPLIYEDPAILSAPLADDKSGEIHVWRKDINLDLGRGRHVKGFAAIRKDGSTTHAGFALFRRNRLIVGSDDDTYRPMEIFGRSNDFRYQRIFGELNLSGFSVSHTKDGFNWQDAEPEFIDALKESLKAEPLDLLIQAQKYRSRVSRNEIQKPIAKQISEVQKALNKPAAKTLLSNPPNIEVIKTSNVQHSNDINVPEQITKDGFRLDVDNQTWHIELITNSDPLEKDWIQTKPGDKAGQDGIDCSLKIILNTGHPAIEGYLGPNLDNLGFIVRIAVTVGLAREKSTRMGLNTTPFMYWLNRILREVVIDGSD